MPQLAGRRRLLVGATLVGFGSGLLASWALGAVVGGVWRQTLSIVVFVVVFNVVYAILRELRAKRSRDSNN